MCYCFINKSHLFSTPCTPGAVLSLFSWLLTKHLSKEKKKAIDSNWLIRKQRLRNRLKSYTGDWRQGWSLTKQFSHPKQWPRKKKKKKKQKWKCVRGENNKQIDEQMGIHRQVPVVFRRRTGPGHTPWLSKDGWYLPWHLEQDTSLCFSWAGPQI